jgi:predicted dinucleotide-binding enzyme
MNIGIIGAGNVGKALAGAAVRAGHAVTISARSADRVAEATLATGAAGAPSSAAAVAEAEAVVLAVPAGAVDAVLDELGDRLDGRTVIDVTNRVNLDDPATVLDGPSNAERIQARVPGARVCKAFNTAFAVRMADPVVDGQRADGFVAGADGDARAAVLGLVADVIFRPVDAGPLPMARVLEGMALLEVMLQVRNGWPWQSAWKLVGPTGEGRGA